MKKTVIIPVLLLLAFSRFAAADFRSGTLPLVDGVYNSTQVVITSRQPLFSWEFTGGVSSFTVVVSSDDVFDSSGELWNCAAATTTANTINDITRVKYDGAAPLEAGATYFWQVTLYDNGAAASAGGAFATVASAAAIGSGKFDLAVDWNNPFNPAQGQVTRFRFRAKDRDRRVQLRLFTLSGMLIRDWPQQTILKDAVYTQEWDGKNADGDVVGRGIYLVNLMDVGEAAGVTKKVAVVK